MIVGAYCRTCTCIKNKANDNEEDANDDNKKHNKLEILKKYGDDNDIIFSKNYDGMYITDKTRIKGQCTGENCSNEFNKQCRALLKTGGLCTQCTQNEASTKTREACIEKYGYSSTSQVPEVKEKMRKTCIEKYGYSSIGQVPEIKEKMRKTNIQKYGVEHVMQHPLIQKKNQASCFSTKQYILPSGSTISYQGYEKFALDELINEDDVDENDIITDPEYVPEIWYRDREGKKHRYYTDIFIVSQHKCIEVKSQFTFQLNQYTIFRKHEAVKAAGYESELRVYDKKGTLIESYD